MNKMLLDWENFIVDSGIREDGTAYFNIIFWWRDDLLQQNPIKINATGKDLEDAELNCRQEFLIMFNKKYPDAFKKME
jgi:hypothetical protein